MDNINRFESCLTCLPADHLWAALDTFETGEEYCIRCGLIRKNPREELKQQIEENHKKLRDLAIETEVLYKKLEKLEG